MIGASEKRSIEFLQWDASGRGYRVWDHPVTPEPLFRRFADRRGEDENLDDGRKQTFLSSFVRRLSERLAPSGRSATDEEQRREETPEILVRDDLVELQAHFSPGLKFNARAYAELFSSLSVCIEPITFEIVATRERIVVGFAIHPQDERLVRVQLEAFFPDVSFTNVHDSLGQAWGDTGRPHVAAVEFGLGKEFMIPIEVGGSDPFVGLVGALSEIGTDEIALFQVIFSPIGSVWRSSIVDSVTHADGSALFVNAPELLAGAKQKTAQSLYAVVVRVATRSENFDRSWEIAYNVAGALGTYGSSRGNELIPLSNDEYPAREHEIDILRRQTHRSGMILSADELAGFVHLPGAEVKSPRLRHVSARTKLAPANVRGGEGLRLGVNSVAGTDIPVVLGYDERVRHIHVVGASGTGKSTLLFNLLRQDLERGEGVSVLDPHGDLIDRVLGVIPEDRIKDVVILDPSDEESVLGFNILTARSDWEKNLLASDLVAVFRRLSTSWGDQMNSVLHNALLAFMESDQGGTLLDVRRFLLEPAFRSAFLKTVHDPNVTYYWHKGFPQLSGSKSVGPIITRLDAFLGPKTVRCMVAQKDNKLDFRDIMDSGRIFLAKLSQGAIGKENSHLLGSLLVAKLQAEAMSRQRQSEAERRYHFLYADEFHDFLTPSLSECLSGVRKYRLGLVLPHQEMRQVERDSDVASALLNAGTRIVFRVNDKDARALEGGFVSFEARDLQNLGVGQAVCRVERSDCDFNLAVDRPEYPEESVAKARRERVTAASRERYGTPRAEIEQKLAREVDGEMAERANESTPAPPKYTATVPIGVATASLAVGKTAIKEDGPPQPIADLGRGGAQHKAIQARIKDEAEKLGFRVTVEKEILGGVGQVDLVLVRDEESIACEVTVTGTIDYEVGNVGKCLKAGFRRVAVVGVSDEKLAKLATAVLNSFGAEKVKSVGYFLPDGFIAMLRETKRREHLPEPEIRSRGGRVVKRAVVPLSADETKAKEEQALSLMVDLMRKKKRSV